MATSPSKRKAGAQGPKNRDKTAISPLNGAQIPLGAHPGNTGGKRGRSGRPSNGLKAFLSELRTKPEVHDAIEAAATDAGSTNFRAALTIMSQYDDEKPAERHEMVDKQSIRDQLKEQGAIIRSMLPSAQADALIRRLIAEVWN